MKVKIIGSGGCVSIPRPCCNCRVCKEAREKGFPYARTGCSLLIEEENILIDTPEDIHVALNNAGVEQVDCVLYSHIDPDHTMGIRVFEQLRMNWLNVSVGIPNENPIQVTTLPRILEDLKKQATRYGSMMEYYEWRGLIKPEAGEFIQRGDLRIDLIPVNKEQTVAIFVLTEHGRKIIYAPCDVKPFPEHSIFQGADVLIIGNTIVGDPVEGGIRVKNGFLMKEDNPLRKDLFILEEVFALKEKYQIPRVIITHLEEDWGKSLDDYKAMEKQYEGLEFAYDGMEVVV